MQVSMRGLERQAGSRGGRVKGKDPYFCLI